MQKIKYVLILSLCLLGLKSYSQGINDIDVIWEKEVNIPSQLPVGILRMNNGNYLSYGYSSTATDIPGSNNEIQLIEFTEAGTIIREKLHALDYIIPTTDPTRTFITHPRFIERPDGGFLVLIEMNHGHNPNEVAERFICMVLDSNFEITTAPYLKGYKFTNYTGFSGMTLNSIIVARALKFTRVNNNLILAAASGGGRNAANAMVGAMGALFLDNDGNIVPSVSSNPNTAFKMVSDKTNTLTQLEIEDNKILLGGDNGVTYVSTDIGGDTWTQFQHRNLACASCFRYEGDLPFKLKGQPGYYDVGQTGRLAPYPDPIAQITFWRWDDNGIIQTSPNPYFQLNHKSYAGKGITINDKHIFSVSNCNLLGNPNSCEGRNRIAQVFPTPDGSSLVYEETSHYLGDNYSLFLSEQSHLKDGVMVYGFSGSKAVIGKVSFCSKYKLNKITDTIVFSEITLPATTLKTTGAFPASTENFSWKVILREGKLSSHPTANAGDILATGNNSIIPSAKLSVNDKDYAVVEIEYSATQFYGSPEMNCSTPASSTIKILSKPRSSYFSDDIWFFGNNINVPENDSVSTPDSPKTSKGMKFTRNKNGTIEAIDYSGRSLVNSWENSLSVSTPACDGSYIFYTQHNRIFNSADQLMENGTFPGNNSVADGLAAAYLGDNKYILVAVGKDGVGPLLYHIIDMNKKEGLGEKIFSGTIRPLKEVSESVELLPVYGTFNKYWLIYYNTTSRHFIVEKIDGTNPSSPTISPVDSFDMSNLRLLPKKDINYRIVANDDYTRVATAFNNPKDLINVHLFYFDPLTGKLSFDRNINLNTPVTPARYPDFVFHNQYLYIGNSGFNRSGLVIQQYDLSSNDLIPQINVNIPLTPNPSPSLQGGGIKKGPDGKIYFIRQNYNKMGVIKNPDLPLNTPNNLDPDGFNLAYGGMGIAISTGLTPPWFDPVGVEDNESPIANPDYYSIYNNMELIMKPLDNDTDPNEPINPDLTLSSVEFVILKDTLKCDLNINTTTKIVTFKQKPTYTPSMDTIFNINYILKDKGMPVSMCDEGFIRVLVRLVPNIKLTDSCSFSPALKMDVQNSNMDFIWEYSEDGTFGASNIISSSLNKKTLPMQGAGFYRVKIYERGKPTNLTYSKTEELVINEKHIVAKKMWYKVSFK